MRVSLENFIKVGIMALLFIALVRIVSDRLGIPGLSALTR